MPRPALLDQELFKRRCQDLALTGIEGLDETHLGVALRIGNDHRCRLARHPNGDVGRCDLIPSAASTLPTVWPPRACLLSPSPPCPVCLPPQRGAMQRGVQDDHPAIAMWPLARAGKLPRHFGFSNQRRTRVDAVPS